MGVTTSPATGTRPVTPARERVVDPEGRETPPHWLTRVDLWVGLLVVAACCTFVFVQLEPRLLLRNTTPTGGDTVSHVWWPAFLRDHLLPWRLAGWSPDFYGGFPAGQFYFPVPALLILALDAVLPYNIAFKLITAAGPIAFPAAAYVLGRGIRVPRPGPAAMAVGATAFLFYTGDPSTDIAYNQHIMGGNLPSMLAGEFSFSVALTFALFFLGTFAFTLRTRERAWLPAILFAATVMSHFVVAIFAVVGALIIWLAHRPRRSFGRAAAVGGVGVLLTAIWVVPLLATFQYTTDTRYEAITRWNDYLFPTHLWDFESLWPWNWGATVGVGIVLAVAIWQRRRSHWVMLGMLAASGILFRFWEDVQATPAWNLRLVPFWYLLLFLIMAVSVADVVRGVGALAVRFNDRRWQWDDDDDDPALLEGASEPGSSEPGDTPVVVRRAPTPTARLVRTMTIAVLTILLTVGSLIDVDDNKDFLPYWIQWNYSGIEAAGKAYPEYRELLHEAGELPPGRLMWEGNQELNVYGSSLALTLLPYFTDGHIASMEGVYYEASATSPYHFLTVASLMPAQSVSNPIRGLPYGTNADFTTGVRRLQVLGVRYLAVHTADAKLNADNDPRLRLVKVARDRDNLPPESWSIYRVADSPLVEPLSYAPVVANHMRRGDAQACAGQPPTPEAVVTSHVDLSEWECLSVPWFDDAGALDRVLTDSGPASWQHAPARRAHSMPKEALPPVRVSRVRTTTDSVSFRVSRPGVPVLVKTSYFPNWEVHGARGPYRATPNFMVVIPTQRNVSLGYSTTTAEWGGRLGTLVGIGGVVALAAWPWWRRRRATRAAPEGRPAATDG